MISDDTWWHRQDEKCDIDGDDAIGIDYDVITHNSGTWPLVSSFVLFKGAFFPDCGVILRLLECSTNARLYYTPQSLRRLLVQDNLIICLTL
jgi:hypothetical protein